MHLLVQALINGAQLLADARGAWRPSSELARFVATAARAAAASQSGRFTVVGDLLAGGVLLIACGVFGLRRSRQ